MKNGYFKLIKDKGFLAFLGTQFMAALNDNLLKWVITFMALAGMLKGGAKEDGTNLEHISEVFIFPSLIFTGVAGWMADNFPKRSVLVLTKAFEILIMVYAFFALQSGAISPPLWALFFLATQFTFFGPAKYGVVPELVPDEELSRANGLLEMSTFMAILLGSVLAGPLFVHFKDQVGGLGLVLIALAILGSLMSLGIPKTAQPATRAPFRLHLFFSEVWSGTRAMYGDRRLWLTNLGICYFWFQGAMFQLVVVLMGKQMLHYDDVGISHLGMWLAIGIGFGSMLAGRLSGDKVELGLVPLGSLGIGLATLLLVLAAKAMPSLLPIALGSVGAMAGLFAVPLNALLQQKAEAGLKGRLLAANNFWSTLAVIASAACLGYLTSKLGMSPDRILLWSAVLSLGMTVYLIWLLPEFVVRFSLWLLTHSLYKIKIRGAERVPKKGAALLVCNHVSLADGLMVQACIQRFVRFMIYKPIYEAKPLNWLFRAGNAIPISVKREDAQIAIEKAREELRAGHVVCIFAEGTITRTGNLLKFKRGLERILDGMEVPVIPVNLDGLWGSIFSFVGGSFRYRFPEHVPYPVTVSFGEAMPATTKASELRLKVQEMASLAMAERMQEPSKGRLELRFLQSAKRHFFSLAMADSSGRRLSYGMALGSALALKPKIQALSAGKALGLLLPPCVPASLINISAVLAGIPSVNLNYTAGETFLDSAIQQCEIQCILSSRRLLEKTGLKERPQMLFIEDFFGEAFKIKALLWASLALLCPSFLLRRLAAVPAGSSSELATVIFSSGSSGEPKGVMLSHQNIAANIDGLAQVLQVRSEDRVLGVLPFFHSLGYTGTIWFPFSCGFAAIYHASPLDAAQIGKLSEDYQVSIALSTPTFYQAYLKKIRPEQFKSLRYAIVGAEKLRAGLAQAFRERYSLELLEGYGATEMAPIVSLNVPDVSAGGEHHLGFKSGSVGQPIPGVSAKVVDPETGRELEVGQSGLLLLKGPNRMLGYWARPDLDAAAMREDWYQSGDIASIDADGFIELHDRVSRFSKIGGEMVPHGRLEEALEASLQDGARCAVTALEDERKGERLLLLHSDASLSPETVLQVLDQAGLPKLWQPKREAILRVEAIPILGSGKTDLKGLKELARRLFAGSEGSGERIANMS